MARRTVLARDLKSGQWIHGSDGSWARIGTVEIHKGTAMDSVRVWAPSLHPYPVKWFGADVKVVIDDVDLRGEARHAD